MDDPPNPEGSGQAGHPTPVAETSETPRPGQLTEASRKRARENWQKFSHKWRKKNKLRKTAEAWRGKPVGDIRKLCSSCAGLKLTAEKFRVRDDLQPHSHAAPSTTNPAGSQSFEIGSGRGRYSLGTLRNIWVQSVNCPFCNLVRLSVEEQDDRNLGEDDTVKDLCCYASWQLDGREIGTTQGTSKSRTRRIRLEWERNTFPEAYIVLLPDHPWAVDSLFLGRHVESSKTNVALINSWIELCRRNHREKCDESVPMGDFEDLRTKPYFGVIDVQEMRLRELPPGSRYIALSYTWGGQQRFTTTRSNVDRLRQRNGIVEYLDLIPLAIQDAIKLVRNINERYLWVDALCIVQDSRKSWSLNARIMDKVYGNADLTICAADDPDAGAGLVALDASRRRFSQHIEEYEKGVHLMVSHLSETYIKRSVWNTRGWTFQERILSRRCLLFTQGRVYFQCRSTALSEDIIAEKENAGWSIDLLHAPLQMLLDLNHRALRVYSQCVGLYTGRKLSDQNDILSAFNGISNLIARKLETDFIWGLPSSHFDWALLWEAGDFGRRRRNLRDESIHMKEPVVFPSWSWCGWKVQADYKHTSMLGNLTNVDEWLQTHTWIIWYIRDGHGELRKVRDRLAPQSPKTEEAPHRDYSGCPTGPGLDPQGRPVRLECGDGETFNRKLPEFPHNITKSPLTRPDSNFPDMSFLQFWTWSAHLRLSDDKSSASVHSRHPGRRCSVLDAKGDWCGTIVLDTNWTRRIGPTLSFEFIAVSEARQFSEEEYDNWNYYIPKDREQSEWDLFHVLLVDYDGGIATRAGLGKVYKQAFENSCAPGKSWKEFILG